MKLSVIIQYSDNINTIKEVISQLTDETELIITAAKMSKELKELETDNITVVKSGAEPENVRKTALSKAAGEFVSFIYANDKISENYIKSILNAITDKADYIPVKWQFINWHGYAFCGYYSPCCFFANVYKKELAARLNALKSAEAYRSLLNKHIRAEPVEKIIYKHWRQTDE